MSISPMSPAAGHVRTGSRRLQDVPTDVIARLQAGESSVNHVEQMAIDMAALFAWSFPELAGQSGALRMPRFLDRMRAGGRVLWDNFGSASREAVARSESDTVRGWGAFAIARSGLPARQQLAHIVPFAADSHFAVREWAWLAVRPAVADELEASIGVLAEMARDEDPYIRRFSCEVIRPRGVWSSHIPALKTSPDLALPVVSRLVSDRHRYVQDSVANWLNDAARSVPDWVVHRMSEWTEEHGDDIRYVRRRALRSLPWLTPA